MVLLDTHTFIWLASNQRRLSSPALRLLRLPGQSAAISIVTPWEVALLSKRGRLKLPLEASDFVNQAIQHHRIAEIPLTRELIFDAVHLPDSHNDPFDRILVATAQAHGLSLISKDRAIAAYQNVTVVW